MSGTYRSLFHASLVAFWCCRECDAALLFCPSCREQLPIRRPKKQPPTLPYSVFISCPDSECRAALAITVCGYKPNPTGDAPAYSVLSDQLLVTPRPRPRPATPTTQSAAATQPARPSKRRAPVASRPTPALRPSKPAPAAPCPPDAERYRLADWIAQGLVPDELPPSAVAAAYRRVFGTEPRRDNDCRTSRSYSLRELGQALGELGRAFEPEPLQEIWQRAMSRVELPSSRMLLAQQAQLRELREAMGPPGTLLAVVAVVAHWLEIAQNRRQLMTDALTDALGQPVAVVVVAQEVQP